MRKHNLSAALPSREETWSPAFKPVKARQDAKPKEGAAVVSYFPTIKGTRRMEKLRRYVHIPMAQLLEADPDIVHWTTEAAAMRINLGDGEYAEVRPHFIARTRVSTIIIRVERTASRLAGSMIDAMTAQLHRQGMELLLLTEEELRAHPLLQVSKDILWHRYCDWPDDLPLEVALLHSKGKAATLGEIHKRVGGAPETWRELLALCGNGFIDIDHSFGLTAGTPVLQCRQTGYQP